jgi:hypothetical protein
MNKEELMMKPVKNLPLTNGGRYDRKTSDKRAYHMETKMMQRQQRPLDVDLSLSVLKDRIGNVIGSIGIIKNNSNNKQMDKHYDHRKKFKQL